MKYLKIPTINNEDFTIFYLPSGHPDKVIKVYEDFNETSCELVSIDDIPINIRDKISKCLGVKDD